MTIEQTECKRCGTCCSKGGPALHKEDMPLLEKGILPFKRLITIRQGELVHKPHESEPVAAKCELVKISGTGKDWQCFYFSREDNGCMMYAERPLACRKLQCWDTVAVEELVEKDTLSRFDIVSADAPVSAFMHEMEAHCPCPDMEKVRQAIAGRETLDKDALEKLVNDDIAIRSTAISKLNITLAEELFYFGRPVFQLLQQLGVNVVEREGRLLLRFP